ncbi:MAG TPA: helix-turn-helix domain-containing protein [Blastocatellia bacterium]|nr:helix-turn-helix domain-containing protein [Blastocatellia bacterium]
MSKIRREGLSVYVETVMKEKRLSRRDVKLRSGGEITDSYVSGIISGTATNLSVQKLKALARGLRVSELELIRVAFGWAKGEEVERAVDQSHNLILVDVAKKSVLSTDIAEIASETLKLSAADRAVVLRYVRRLIRTERRLRRKGSV